MRIAACLVAVCCASAAGLAQGPIEWSSVRRLTKADFKGRVPAAAPTASMSTINLDASWECKGGALIASVRATFDPARSWWRSAQGGVWGTPGEQTSSTQIQQNARSSSLVNDMQLLEHEQIHFDIAEAAARKIRARFAGLKSACADPSDTADLRLAVGDAERELQEEQARYDRETSHGTNARAQEQWKRRIAALLN
jgi:hypothetical protein